MSRIERKEERMAEMLEQEFYAEFDARKIAHRKHRKHRKSKGLDKKKHGAPRNEKFFRGYLYYKTDANMIVKCENRKLRHEDVMRKFIREESKDRVAVEKVYDEFDSKHTSNEVLESMVEFEKQNIKYAMEQYVTGDRSMENLVDYVNGSYSELEEYRNIRETRSRYAEMLAI